MVMLSTGFSKTYQLQWFDEVQVIKITATSESIFKPVLSTFVEVELEYASTPLMMVVSKVSIALHGFHLLQLSLQQEDIDFTGERC